MSTEKSDTQNVWCEVDPTGVTYCYYRLHDTIAFTQEIDGKFYDYNKDGELIGVEDIS